MDRDSRQTLSAESTREQLQWGGVCMLGLVFVGSLKMCSWLEIHTNRALRELKRVELLLLQWRGPNARALPERCG